MPDYQSDAGIPASTSTQHWLDTPAPQEPEPEVSLTPRRDPAETPKAIVNTYAKLLTPGLYNYLTKPNPPPTLPPSDYVGKVQPSDYNPYAGPALEDVRNLALTALPGGRVEAGAEWAASQVPRALSAIREAGVGTANAASATPPSKVAAIPPTTAAAPQAPAPAADTGSIRPAFTQDDLSRMNQLQTDITSLTARRAAATKDIGPKKAAIEGKVYDDQIKAKQDEIAQMRTDMLNKQSVFDMATQPIAVRNADAVAQARAAAMGLSGATGTLHGLAHRPGLWPWVQSGLLGGLEGSLGVVGPNLYDLGAPKGTPAREAAEKNLRFLSHPTEPGAWDYAQNVIAPEFGGGAGISVAGHGTGHAITSAVGSAARGVMSLFGRGGPPVSPPASPMPSTPPTAAMPVASTSGKIWPDDPRQINMFKDAAGNWREQGTGHFVPKRLRPPDKSGTLFGRLSP